MPDKTGLSEALEVVGVVKTLLLIGHASNARLWESELTERLRGLSYRLAVAARDADTERSGVLNTVLKVEARKFGISLATLAPRPASNELMDVDLIIDLTGKTAPNGPTPILTLAIAGATSIDQGLQRLRTAPNAAPQIVAKLNGQAVAIGHPMLGDRVWLSRDCNDVLTACQNLIVLTVKRFIADRLQPVEEPRGPSPSRSFAIGYGLRLLQGLTGRALHRLKPGSRPFYWQTGYRLIDGAGVAESRRLDGPPFIVLPDDGERFYADPFPFKHQGKSYLFVEEFPYSLGRGIISVSELKPEGRFERPRPVLEEPHHLSYPNVFEQDGEIFMIPESGSANEVVLYRAETFPDRWVRDTVLLEGRCFNDATLLERDGRFWMFGTERFGRGSASDTLMVYSATDLRGPWKPHPLSPILIDRAGARPGGHFIHQGGKTFLPVQDGTLKYGGGLGLRELIKLDDEDVVLGPVLPVTSGPAWHVKGIHTLTRSGRLEIIDSTP